MNTAHRVSMEQKMNRRRVRRIVQAQLRRACKSIIERRERRELLRSFNGHVLVHELRTGA